MLFVNVFHHICKQQQNIPTKTLTSSTVAICNNPKLPDALTSPNDLFWSDNDDLDEDRGVTKADVNEDDTKMKNRDSIFGVDTDREAPFSSQRLIILDLYLV